MIIQHVSSLILSTNAWGLCTQHILIPSPSLFFDLQTRCEIFFTELSVQHYCYQICSFQHQMSELYVVRERLNTGKLSHLRSLLPDCQTLPTNPLKYAEWLTHPNHNYSCGPALYRTSPAPSSSPAVTQLRTHLEMGHTVADSCCGMLLWHQRPSSQWERF